MKLGESTASVFPGAFMARVANWAARQPSDYHIKFVYRPLHWRLALALFWEAVGLGAVGLIWHLWCKRRMAEPAPDVSI